MFGTTTITYGTNHLDGWISFTIALAPRHPTELTAERKRYEAWGLMLSLREPAPPAPPPVHRDPKPRNLLLLTGRARAARRPRRRWRRPKASTRRAW